MIPVNTPLFIGNEKKYLNDCIDSGWVSSEGYYVKKFEEALSGYYDKKYTVAVTNGSVALDLAVEALELSPGDEFTIHKLVEREDTDFMDRGPDPTK